MYIVSHGSVSALGSEPGKIWERYKDENSCLSRDRYGTYDSWVGKLRPEDNRDLEVLRQSSPQFRTLDRSVLLAIMASRRAVAESGWDPEVSYGINIGSSRGATGLFEKYHKEFLESGKSATLASPTTTLGNIASWVAQDRLADGPVISHSITCSTALHALVNAVAWLGAGMAEKFLVGGAEAALTSFTIAQMEALKILSKEEPPYPSRPLDPNKKANTMVLGEGAAVLCLDTTPVSTPVARVEGIGMATERLSHNASISTEAYCFQQSMKMALGDVSPAQVAAIVAHAPGTLRGDRAEQAAIQKVFGTHTPLVTANKWKIGHTFGASGLLSLELALGMIAHQEFISIPYLKNFERKKEIKKVLVNAVGFGGNAVSVLISKPG